MYYRRPPHSYQAPIRFGPAMTPVVKALIIACSGVFVLQLLLFGNSPTGLSSFWGIFGLAPARVLGNLWIWQPITYMFLHGGVWHLLLNMFMLWMFGSDLEMRWGSRRFLNFYLICGLGAAVTTAIFDYHSRSIGASGAIFGVLLAYGMLFPRRVILLWMIFPIQARYFVWICAGIELWSVIQLQNATDGIAHWAHLGGMLVGFLYLRRAWKLRDILGQIRWKIRRSRFRVIDPPDDDPDDVVH